MEIQTDIRSGIVLQIKAEVKNPRENSSSKVVIRYDNFDPSKLNFSDNTALVFGILFLEFAVATAFLIYNKWAMLLPKSRKKG